LGFSLASYIFAVVVNCKASSTELSCLVITTCSILLKSHTIDGAFLQFQAVSVFLCKVFHTRSNRKPIKKPELLILKKSVASRPTQEQVPEVDTELTNEPIVDQQPPFEPQNQATEYLTRYEPVQDYPVLQSVSDSGWQPSDIWRDLRIDRFCE